MDLSPRRGILIQEGVLASGRELSADGDGFGLFRQSGSLAGSFPRFGFGPGRGGQRAGQPDAGQIAPAGGFPVFFRGEAGELAEHPEKVVHVLDAHRRRHLGVGKAGGVEQGDRPADAQLGDVLRDAAAVLDRKSTRLNSSHVVESRMPSSA